MPAKSGWSRVVLVVAAGVVLSHPPRATAQSQDSNRPRKFDVSRMAPADSTIETFNVSETQPLRQALNAGTVKEDTRVLVTQTAGGRLALVVDQMASHPIAQGRAGGREWMATF